MKKYKAGDSNMKVFVSWSGNLSKKIADAVNKWLPCLLQTVEVFYSPDDIEKGENWDQKISNELANCKFGIICLTPENVSAPWINFEAGAIAKSLESHVATLMININPSDIKGPLSRYQATKLEREDFFRLIQDINNNSDSPILSERISNTFEGLWPNIDKDLNEIVIAHKPNTKAAKKSPDAVNSEAVEEILQLVRKQTTILSSPDMLLPRAYIEYIFEGTLPSNLDAIENLLSYLDFAYRRLRNEDFSFVYSILNKFQVIDFIMSLDNGLSRRNRAIYEHYADVRRRFTRLNDSILEQSKNDTSQE